MRKPCIALSRCGSCPPPRLCPQVFLVDDGSATAGPQHYVGLYVATERITIGPSRLAGLVCASVCLS